MSAIKDDTKFQFHTNEIISHNINFPNENDFQRNCITKGHTKMPPVKENGNRRKPLTIIIRSMFLDIFTERKYSCRILPYDGYRLCARYILAADGLFSVELYYNVWTKHDLLYCWQTSFYWTTLGIVFVTVSLPRPYMMASSTGNIFRVTGPLCGEFTGHRWIPLTYASDAELRCFLWSVPE